MLLTTINDHLTILLLIEDISILGVSIPNFKILKIFNVIYGTNNLKICYHNLKNLLTKQMRETKLRETIKYTYKVNKILLLNIKESDSGSIYWIKNCHICNLTLKIDGWLTYKH